VPDSIFKINDADTGSDGLEAHARGDGITLTVEEPWAGDTVSGFGRECTIRISKEQAIQLAEWLLAHSK
jgi:hypothetical protein